LFKRALQKVISDEKINIRGTIIYESQQTFARQIWALWDNYRGLRKRLSLAWKRQYMPITKMDCNEQSFYRNRIYKF
jgi:hypothetical protein